MIDPKLMWQAAWDSLPLDPTGLLYATNIANLINNRLAGLSIPGITGSVTFTFGMAAFAAGISNMPLDPTGTVAPATYAAAFSAACSSSVILIASGASVGASTPATTFAAPPVSLFDPASVAAASSVLQVALLNPQLAPVPLSSIYPRALHTAFTSLMVSATGLNMLVPPAGPLPLIFSGGVL